MCIGPSLASYGDKTARLAGDADRVVMDAVVELAWSSVCADCDCGCRWPVQKWKNEAVEPDLIDNRPCGKQHAIPANDSKQSAAHSAKSPALTARARQAAVCCDATQLTAT